MSCSEDMPRLPITNGEPSGDLSVPHPPYAPGEARANQSSRLVRIVLLVALVLIPLRILGRGFLPPDDALRHAAKAVSGREWSEILVLRPGLAMDSHPGWHAMLRALHLAAGFDTHALVLVSVVGLFAAISLAPVLLMRRPEAWAVALLALLLTEPQMPRLLLGRPFLLAEAVLLAVLLLWPRLRSDRTPWPTLSLIALLLALATWAHGNWYLWTLPVACFFLARQQRAGLRLAAAALAGIVIGAALTGRPLLYLEQAVRHGFLALGATEPAVTLATEFRPFAGAPLVVGLVLAALAFRHARGRSAADALRDPVFVLAAVGWALGFVAIRFYADWAAPAVLLFLAREIEDALESGIGGDGRRRLSVALVAGSVLFVAFASDQDSRWSLGANDKFLARDNPQHAPWLPEPTGILYSTDMWLFYRTFFRNPDAPWRYMTGFEPGLMPPEDLATYRAILRGHGATETYEPWVRRMRPEDRLFIRLASNAPPPVPGLEWYQVEFSIWSGRLPKTPPAPAR
jgi:hypothetical protein